MGIEGRCEDAARRQARALFAAFPLDDRRPDTGEGTTVPDAALRDWLNGFVAAFALDPAFPCRADDAGPDCVPADAAGRDLVEAIAPLRVEGARAWRVTLRGEACFIPDYDVALDPGWSETHERALLTSHAARDDDGGQRFVRELYVHRDSGAEVEFVERVANEASCVADIVVAVPAPKP
jgi:hypothetical protein